MRFLVVVALVLLVAAAFGCRGEEPSIAEPTAALTETATSAATVGATLGPPTGTPYPYPSPFVTVTPASTPTPLPDPERTVEGTGTPAGCFPSSPNPSEAAVDLGEPIRYARGIYSVGLYGGGLTLLADNPGPGQIPPGSSARGVSFDQQGGRAVFLAEGSKLFLSDLQARTPPHLLVEFHYVTDFALAPDGRSLVVLGAYGDLGGGLFRVDTADGSVEAIPVTFESAGHLSWSPSGDRLAAAGIREQAQQAAVYMFRPDGSDLIQVAEDWQTLAWSPDGSRLALGGQGISLADAEAWVRKVSDSATYWETALAWSPDGRCLAFAAVGPEWEDPPSIRVLDVETGWEVFLASNAMQPVWSPDGSRIAFLRDGNLWVMNTDGSQQTRLTNPRQPFVQEPFWLPDGSGLLFAFVPPMATSVYVINPDGTDEVNLADGSGPVWAPDGTQIAFRGGGWVALGSSDEIFVMNSDGTGVHKIGDSLHSDALSGCWTRQPYTWSPDGRLVLYCDDSEGGIVVAPADGGTQPELLVRSVGADWAPDGLRFVYSVYDASRSGWQIHVRDYEDSGEGRWLAEGMYPLWSPDGQRIAFVRYDSSGGHDVYVVDVDGTGESRLIAAGSPLSWSPDGSTLALRASGLMVVDVASGESRRLADSVRDAVWSPEGTQLVFSAWDDPNSPDTSRVYIVNADGSGEPRVLSDGSDPSWSPDGSRIAFAR